MRDVVFSKEDVLLALASMCQFQRIPAFNWESKLPIIVRAMRVAPDGSGGELVFSAGIVEGTTPTDWDKSTRCEGPGKLLVHSGTDGRLLADYDLPACPVFDGLSAASGKILVGLVNGHVLCLHAVQKQP